MFFAFFSWLHHIGDSWSVISQFYKVYPSIIASSWNPSLQQNCCYYFNSAWLCILYFWISSHPCYSSPQGHLSSLHFCKTEKYSSVLMMTPKLTMSVNFISSFPTSLLRQLMKSLDATDNLFLLDILPVYCNSNIYPLFYCSSLSSITVGLFLGTMSNTLLKFIYIRATIFSFDYQISFNRVSGMIYFC